MSAPRINLKALLEVDPNDPVANLCNRELSLRSGYSWIAAAKWTSGENGMPYSAYQYVRLQLEHPDIAKPHPSAVKPLRKYLEAKDRADTIARRYRMTG